MIQDTPQREFIGLMHFFGESSSETGTVGISTVNISGCDPRVSSLSGACTSALSNWFQTKSVKSKMQSSSSIITSRNMKKLKISKANNYRSDGLGGYLPIFNNSSSFDFNPDSANVIGTFSAGDISDYFSEEQNSPSGNLEGIEDLRKHRLICDLVSCGIDLTNASFTLKTVPATHGSYVKELAKGPNDEIYGIIWQGGFVKSTDNGASFSVKKSSAGFTDWQYPNSIMVEPNGTIWIVAANKLYKSTDGGDSFSKYGTEIGLPTVNLSKIYRGPSGKIYIAHVGTSYSVSTNGGSSFSTISSGLSYALWAFLEKSNGDLLIAGYGGGLYKTTDNGANFTLQTTDDGLPANDLMELHIDNNSIIYAGTNNSGLLKSTDGGDSWVTKTNSDGLGNNRPTDFFTDTSGTTYISLEYGGFSYTSDGATTFDTKTQNNSGLGSNRVRSVVVGEDYIAVAVYGDSNSGGIYIYSD